jgi:single-strand DNA-binding protein
MTSGEQGEDSASTRNEVVVRGRLPAAAEERTLPSGDVIVSLRIVVPRPVAAPAKVAQPRAGVSSRAGAQTTATEVRRATVDTIDVVCWTARSRRSAMRLQPGDTVEVEGALRRRFFGGAGGRQSRYEVEAAAVRRVARGGRVAS